MGRLNRVERFRLRSFPSIDRNRARILQVAWLPAGTAAMTFGRWILVRREHRKDLQLLAHELVHVRQWRELGALGFLLAYLGPYLTGRAKGLSHWEAYAHIPLEVEARTKSG